MAAARFMAHMSAVSLGPALSCGRAASCSGVKEVAPGSPTGAVFDGEPAGPVGMLAKPQLSNRLNIQGTAPLQMDPLATENEVKLCKKDGQLGS